MQSSDAADARATGARRTDPLLECSLDGLRRRTSAKWRHHPPDVLPLWVAEMDVPLAPPVAEALREAVALGDTGYAPGPEAYADAFDAFARDRWGWRIRTARTRLVPDVMQGVSELLRLLTGPDDAVVVNAPVYAPFYSAVTRIGRRVVEAPLGEDHRLDPDVLADAFAAAVAGGRRAAFLLCSPHNPTGTVHTRTELAAVAELAEAHGVRVVSDEIHAPLVLPRGRPEGDGPDGEGPDAARPDAAFVPYLEVRGAERGFTVISASKAWNLAGLKAALAVAGEAAESDLARLPAEVGNGASHLGVIAHVAALRHGGGWLDSLLTGLVANRTLLSGLLERHLPEVVFRPPDGTFLAWLDCRALDLGDDPAAAFLERGRVALVAGPVFGTGGAGHARLNFATSPDILTEAVRRMAAAV